MQANVNRLNPAARRRRFLHPALLVTFVACLGATGILEFRRRELRREVIELKHRGNPSTALREKPLLRPAANTAQATRQTSLADMELQEARREIATLERHASARRAEIVAASAQRLADASGGRATDPTQGMTRLELLQNVGRDTPSAALQTLVWAALKGEESLLQAGLALDDAARERAVDLAARLPPDTRSKTTPEKLAALWFTDSVLDVPAMYIAGQEVNDDAHVTLLVRGGIADTEKLTMLQSPDGWKIVVPVRALEGVKKKLAFPSPTALPP